MIRQWCASTLSEVVRSTVQDTLNTLLDTEADRLCGAKRYEHKPERVDTRAGHYERQLHTKAGEGTLQMPKLRSLPFETAIIDRYRRRETSVEQGYWRCIKPACRCARSRTSPKRCGYAGEPQQGERAQPEGRRPDRGVTQLADRGRARLRLPRRHLAEAQLGRRSAQRQHPGRHRRQPGRLPRSARRRRRYQGGQGLMAKLPATSRHPRTSVREAVCRRQVPGLGREPWWSSISQGVSALRGAFLPQCLVARACDQSAPRGRDAEGHPRKRRPRGRPRQGAARRRQALRTEVARGRCARARPHRGDIQLLRLPSRRQRSLRTNIPLERIMREIRHRTRVVARFPTATPRSSSSAPGSDTLPVRLGTPSATWT